LNFSRVDGRNLVQCRVFRRIKGGHYCRNIKSKYSEVNERVNIPLGRPEAPGRYEGTLPAVGVGFKASVAFGDSEGPIAERGTAVGLVEARETERVAA
jgi:hypothetical protein